MTAMNQEVPKRQRGAPSEAPAKLLHRQTVLEMTGISRTHLYRLINQGNFPPPIKIGSRGVRWNADAVNAWIANGVEWEDAA